MMNMRMGMGRRVVPVAAEPPGVPQLLIDNATLIIDCTRDVTGFTTVDGDTVSGDGDPCLSVKGEKMPDMDGRYVVNNTGLQNCRWLDNETDNILGAPVFTTEPTSSSDRLFQAVGENGSPSLLVSASRWWLAAHFIQFGNFNSDSVLFRTNGLFADRVRLFYNHVTGGYDLRIRTEAGNAGVDAFTGTGAGNIQRIAYYYDGASLWRFYGDSAPVEITAGVADLDVPGFAANNLVQFGATFGNNRRHHTSSLYVGNDDGGNSEAFKAALAQWMTLKGGS